MERKPLVILRRLKASPRAVWRALTAPDELPRWTAPDDAFEVITAHADERTGHYQGALRAAGATSSATFELTPAGDGTELLVRCEGCARQEQDAWKARIRRLARHMEAR